MRLFFSSSHRAYRLRRFCAAASSDSGAGGSCFVACTCGASDRVMRGESRARTVAKGSSGVSTVGLAGLGSLKNSFALASAGELTCTSLPVPVVSAAIPGMTPVPGGGTNPSASFTGDPGGWSGMRGLCGLRWRSRGRLPFLVVVAKHKLIMCFSVKKSNSQTTERDRGARDSSLEAPVLAPRGHTRRDSIHQVAASGASTQ